MNVYRLFVCCCFGCFCVCVVVVFLLVVVFCWGGGGLGLLFFCHISDDLLLNKVYLYLLILFCMCNKTVAENDIIHTPK